MRLFVNSVDSLTGFKYYSSEGHGFEQLLQIRIRIQLGPWIQEE